MILTHKVYVITDLGPGDGGKGGVVHKIASAMHAHTVIKRGGAQGSHGVRTSRGESFNFSQWGCGTLEGIPTFISDQFIASPEGLLNEADALRYQCGIHDPFNLLSVDKNALCATPFHRISSHIKELARGDSPRGTIGTGVGEAYRDYQNAPEIAIKVKNLFDSNLDERLMAIFEYQREKLKSVIEDGNFLNSDHEIIEQEKALLYDDGFLTFTVNRFKQASKQLHISRMEDILHKGSVAVVECSHGVLNDAVVGFKPHTSAIRILPRFTHDMLRMAGFNGNVINIGVTRAYAIRHGAGPLPTADTIMAESLLPSSSKDENRWQGKVRVGPLDFVQLRHAVKSCGGSSCFDGLAVTWLDQIKANGVWNICDRYINGIPEITSIPVDPSLGYDELYAVCAEVMEKRLNIPVRMVSCGPTELDKILK